MEADSNLETTAEAVVRDFDNQAIQLIDVRERDEWAEGWIAGSLLIPMSEFTERVAEIDPARPVVTVCRVGARSLYVAEALQAAGYRRVKSMAGGLNAWIEAGQPLEFG